MGILRVPVGILALTLRCRTLKHVAQYSPLLSEQVKQDIAAIASKGFSNVRLYSTDCSTLQFVGQAAKSHGLKIMPGIFVDRDGVGVEHGGASSCTGEGDEGEDGRAEEERPREEGKRADSERWTPT